MEISKFWYLQTPERREKVGKYISYEERRRKNSRRTYNAMKTKIKELGET
jgi:hypothetical protein